MVFHAPSSGWAGIAPGCEIEDLMSHPPDVVRNLLAYPNRFVLQLLHAVAAGKPLIDAASASACRLPPDAIHERAVVADDAQLLRMMLMVLMLVRMLMVLMVGGQHILLVIVVVVVVHQVAVHLDAARSAHHADVRRHAGGRQRRRRYGN